jgi:subtilase family serine protease
MQTALAFAFVFLFSLMAAGQQAAIVPARITQPVDLENLVTLRGNTHPLARPEFDQGAAPDSLPTERMLLVLQRSSEQEAALRKLLDGQQIKSSPNYHMWLTPEQFGQQFGPADADIQAVTDWLTSQGFQVSRVAAGRTVIEFSGTAGQVRQAFHTEIHKFVVNGEEHWANASDPQIPAALTPVVAGFASLNNFPKRPQAHRLGTFSKSKATGVVRPLFTYPYENGYLFGLGPTDFATIYNVLPLWNASPAIDGTGQTIAIVGQTNINIQDVVDFRTMFGLPAQSPQTNPLCQAQSQVPVNVCLNGPDPGIIYYTGDEGESDVDVEWAGAVAKGATIDLVVSESTEVTAGIDLSALYIIDNNLAPVMSESYGACEAYLGNAGNSFYSTVWEQGAAQGITILEAIGDSGSAGCDEYASTGVPAAQYGLMVDGFGSTPFNVAVGGTDFNDASNPQQFWNPNNNSTTQSSALSYIPEMTWNDTCARTGLLSNCVSAGTDIPAGIDLHAGGGGPSNCVTSTSTACTGGYAKPSWQTGTGVPNDGVRDTPDVSLFAADGYISGSFYVFCEMDANTGSGANTSSCDLNAPYLDFQGSGGTSVSTQVFGAIMALVNQKTGQRQGNANYVLYPLAATAATKSEYCAASASPPASCIFYDVQAGNNSVACEAGSPNCGNTSSNYGILVNPNNTAQPAWATSAGYDLATGLGSVNVENLVNNWTSVSFAPTTTTLAISPTTITHGQSVTLNVGVTSTSGTPTGDVSLVGGPNNSNLGITYVTLGANGTVSEPTIFLPGGTYGVTARYAGDGIHGSSSSSPFQVTVNPESSQTFIQMGAYTTDCSGSVTYFTSVQYGYSVLCSGGYYPYWLRVVVTNGSGNVCYNTTTSITAYQCPTGQVTVTNNGGAITDLGAPSDYSLGTYTLNSQGTAEDYFIQLPGGTDALSASYTPHPIAPNNSYNSSTGTATITVTQAATATSVAASTTTPTSGQSVTLTATVSTTSIGFAPSGTVAFYNGSNLISGTPTYTPANAPTSPTNPFASYTATLTTSFTATATITAKYLGDTNYTTSTSAPITLTLSNGTADFGLAASPTSFSIAAPGDSGQTAISVSPINSFTGTVSFTCTLSAAMTYSSCSVVPTSITLPATTSTVLSVNTTAPSTTAPLFKRPGWFMPSAGAIFACLLLLLFPGKKRRAKLAFGLLVFALLAAALVACGGGSSSTGPTNPGTPPGTYTATVTATSGTLSHSLNVPVTVQ